MKLKHFLILKLTECSVGWCFLFFVLWQLWIHFTTYVLKQNNLCNISLQGLDLG